MSNLISCPSCNHEIAVNEVLQSQLSEQIRRELQAELQAKQTEVIAAKKHLVQQEALLADQQKDLAAKIDAGIASERSKITAAAKQAAEASLTVELKDRDAQLKELQAKLTSAQQSELELRKKERELEAKAKELKLSAARELDAERDKITAAAKKAASESLTIELKDRDAQLKELQSKLTSAQQNELELRKKERELETQTKELKLSVARELDAERSKIHESAMKQFADERQLKDAESAKVVSDMRRQIDDLKRRAEQGSMQTQGEAQELALESVLESTFPVDSIQPVAKGTSGADCKQIVFCPSGINCGNILWESKNTKAFSKGWIPKLRDDKRTARASVAVLVTQAMPDGIDTFALIDGVWVCSWKCAKGLAMALRAGLIEVGKNRIASEGRVEKMELVYNYLSGEEFVGYVDGIVEAFVEMETDLAKDKRVATASWGRRQKQIERMMTNTTSLYGDLQGIIGGAMPAVNGLEPLKITQQQVAEDTKIAR